MAREALRAADGLRASAPAPNPSAVLYASAIRLLLAVHERRASEAVGPLDGLDDAQRSAVSSALAPDGVLFLSRLEPCELARVSHALRVVSRELTAPFAREALAARRAVLRRTGIACATLVLSVAGAWALLRHPNLARGRPVEVAALDAGYDASKLVDGDVTNIGFHASGLPHVATIDLGSARLVSRVVVHNRFDCCEARAVPLSVQLGDGRSFHAVADRAAPFHVWHASFAPERARYVRLESRSSEPFHLSEVEVY